MFENFFVFVLLFLTSVTCSSVVFEDCGSAFELEVVNIEGCGNRLPCYVTLGEQITVDLQFIADRRPLILDQDVVINVNHVNLRTTVKPDPCTMRECPVLTNIVTSFTSVMTVPKNMALNQRGWLRWRVYSENGRQVLCFSVLVQTQSQLQKTMTQIQHHLTPNATVETATHKNLNKNVPTLTKQTDYRTLLNTTPTR